MLKIPESDLRDGFRLLAAREFQHALETFDKIDAALGDWQVDDESLGAMLEVIASHGFQAANGAGRHERSLVFAQHAVDLVERFGGSGYTRARVLNNRGLARLELGRLVEAEADFDAALLALDEGESSNSLVNPENLRQVIQSHLNILRGLQGRPIAATSPRRVSALDELGPAFFGLNQHDPDIDAVNEAFSAASIAAQTGDLVEATEIYSRCVANLSARASPKAAGIARSNLGNALLAEGAIARAIEVLEESVRLLEHTERPSEPLALVLHALAEAQLRAAGPSAAATVAKAAWLEIDRASPQTPQALIVLHTLAKIRVFEKDFERARAALRHASTIYDANRPHFAANEEGHAGTFATFRALTELMLLVSVHEQFPDEALDWIENAKARFWEDQAEFRGPIAKSKDHVSENVILSDIFGEPDCLILNYFVGPNYTFVVSIFNNIIGASRINVGTTGLEDIIDRFRHDLQSPHNTLPGHVDGLELSKLLPDQALERDLDVVIVAPDGPLWRLPFDALPASAGPRSGDLVSGRANLIGDVAPVWITPTLRLFRRLRDRAALLPTTSECVLVVWRTRYAGFATIKQAEAEGAEVVSKARPRLVVHLAEADAIPEAVSRAMPKADIIHIATHAIVGSGDAPSAIVLSGPAGTDVFLSATEIAGLRLKAQVVFLSCCGSALGQASEGEGLVSVGRAFLFAGARCVIASIWPVEDQLTATFVGLFYDQLFGGDVPGIALHSARETLKNPAAGADIG